MAGIGRKANGMRVDLSRCTPSDVEQVDWHFQGVTVTVIYISLQGQLVCPQYAVPIHHIPFHYAMTDVYLAVIYGFVTKSHIYTYVVHIFVKNKCCIQII